MGNEREMDDSFARLQVEDNKKPAKGRKLIPTKVILHVMHEAREELVGNEIGVHAVRRSNWKSTREIVRHFNNLIYNKLHTLKEEEDLDNVIIESRAEMGIEE